MPSAAFRFALEAAFLILVALGAGLARLEPVVIIALMAVAWVLVAVVERASAREAARAGEEPALEEAPAATEPEPEHVAIVEVPAAREAREPELAAEPEPAVAVDERSARAILASAPPPGAEPARSEQPEPELEPEPEPEPEP